MRRGLAAVLLLFVLAVPAAQAHVTVKPKQVKAGASVRFTIEAENERDAASTEKLDIQLPASMQSVSIGAPAGWKRRVHGPRRLTLTAKTEEAKIGPRATRDFRFSARTPARPGTVVFKILQSYDNGEVVRWIGPPGSDEPAARVEVTAPAVASTPAAAGKPDDADEDDDDDDGIGTVGIVVVALLAALAALALAALVRRRRRYRRNR
jgi:MYXO-CTERM domain-containing protein